MGVGLHSLPWSPAGHCPMSEGYLGRLPTWWHPDNYHDATSRNTLSIFEMVEREQLKGLFIHSKSLFQQLMGRFSTLSDVSSSKLLTPEVTVALSRALALCSPSVFARGWITFIFQHVCHIQQGADHFLHGAKHPLTNEVSEYLLGGDQHLAE